jgi:hypothetical protein
MASPKQVCHQINLFVCELQILTNQLWTLSLVGGEKDEIGKNFQRESEALQVSKL